MTTTSSFTQIMEVEMQDRLVIRMNSALARNGEVLTDDEWNTAYNALRAHAVKVALRYQRLRSWAKIVVLREQIELELAKLANR